MSDPIPNWCLGEWAAVDPDSNVELRVSAHGSGLKVELVDLSDGESAQILRVMSTRNVMVIEANWPSTNWWVRHSLTPGSQDLLLDAMTFRQQWSRLDAPAPDDDSEEPTIGGLEGNWTAEPSWPIEVSIIGKSGRPVVRAHHSVDKHSYVVSSISWDGSILSFDLSNPSRSWRALHSMKMSESPRCGVEVTLFEQWTKRKDTSD